MPQTINPATGEKLGEFSLHSREQVNAALTAAVEAQQEWRTRPILERASLLRAMAVELRADSERYAHAITAEMGKPIRESRAEIEKCALTCDFYAGKAHEFLRLTNRSRQAPPKA